MPALWRVPLRELNRLVSARLRDVAVRFQESFRAESSICEDLEHHTANPRVFGAGKYVVDILPEYQNPHCAQMGKSETKWRNGYRRWENYS